MGAGGRAERRRAWAARIYRLVWPRPGARASGAARPFAAGFFGAFRLAFGAASNLQSPPELRERERKEKHWRGSYFVSRIGALGA